MIKVAIYCRLSEEDKNKQNSFDESESIQNQKSILLNYAMEKGWEIYKIYCDEDYSGVDTDRPEFNQLLQDAQNKKFIIILCKTQSRFTRDMELVEKYLHGRFLEWGIRFISLVDNADTYDKANKKSRQINGLINEWYLEDMSENIKAVFRNKHREGKSTHPFLPYGYKKHPENKNKPIIDSEPADVVQEIFNNYVSGISTTKIAYLLNERGIVPPQVYKKESGEKLSIPNKNMNGLWNPAAVVRIIRNQMYVGDLVQCAYRKVSYKSKKIITTPKEEWTIVPNTHDAIIDRATFEKAQRIMDSRIKPMQNGEAHIFAKKVRCSDCGSALHRTLKKYKDREYSYLRCRMWLNSSHKPMCTSHRIRFEDLVDIVSEKIKRYFNQICDIESVSEQIDLVNPVAQKIELIQNELKSIEQKKDKYKNFLKDLYNDKFNGIISDSEFVELKSDYAIRQEKNNVRQKQNEKELQYLQQKLSDSESKSEIIEKYRNFNTLTRNMVDELIDFIEIGEENPITKEQSIIIHWLI